MYQTYWLVGWLVGCLISWWRVICGKATSAKIQRKRRCQPQEDVRGGKNKRGDKCSMWTCRGLSLVSLCLWMRLMSSFLTLEQGNRPQSSLSTCTARTAEEIPMCAFLPCGYFHFGNSLKKLSFLPLCSWDGGLEGAWKCQPFAGLISEKAAFSAILHGHFHSPLSAHL